MITIDGPAGAGKSTVARALAQRLDGRFLDTGAIYRTVTWLALERSIGLSDGPALVDLLNATSLTQDADGRMRVDGVLVDEAAIRNEHVTAAVSEVAACAPLREALLPVQRHCAEGDQDLICEGRDMGTIVFPEAAVKIWLDASLEERARRRGQDPVGRTASEDLGGVAAQLAARDQKDSERKAAPLKRGADQVVVDTTGLSIEGVVDRLFQLVQAESADQGDSRR